MREIRAYGTLTLSERREYCSFGEKAMYNILYAIVLNIVCTRITRNKKNHREVAFYECSQFYLLFVYFEYNLRVRPRKWKLARFHTHVSGPARIRAECTRYLAHLVHT